jgi:hypothetical protein
VETNSTLAIRPMLPLIAFADGSEFSGPGVVRFPTDSGYFQCEGLLLIDAESTVEFAGSQGGKVWWGGTGKLKWVFGGMRNATFGPGLQMEISGDYDKWMFGNCTNLTTLHWKSVGGLSLDGSALFNNTGTIVLETNCALNTPYAAIENWGLITTAPGGGTVLLRISCSFTNRADISAETNTVLEIQPVLSNVAFVDGTEFLGPGLVRLSSWGGAFTCDGVLLVNGEVELTGNQQWGKPWWGGVGKFRWALGSMSNATFGPGLQVEFTDNYYKKMQGSCTNLATLQWSGDCILNAFAPQPDALFYNQGLIQVEGIGSLIYPPHLPLINDPEGTFHLLGGDFWIDALTNRGTVILDRCILTVQNAFVQTASGTYRVALGGKMEAAEFNQLQAHSFVMDGALVVTLTNGFVPAIGDSFLIASNNVQIGKFSATTLPTLASDAAWRVRYLSNGVQLDVVPAITIGEYAMLPNGSFQFSFAGPSSGVCEVQASTNLIDWLNLATNDSFSGSMTFTDTNAPSFSRRFYRIHFPE